MTDIEVIDETEYVVKMVRDVPAGTPVVPFIDETFALQALESGADITKYPLERVPKGWDPLSPAACIVLRTLVDGVILT